MNTIYIVTYSVKRGRKGQQKVKSFDLGEKDKAMAYGWKLAFRKTKNEYFIITEDKKCLRFNRQIIL